MTEKNVSLFVSHKIKIHQRAAKRIKEILQSRAECLDVYICEDTTAGIKWRELIQDKLTDAHILLMLLPPYGSDVDWIKSEILTFRAAHPEGWVVPFKRQSDKVPDFLTDLQVIDITVDNIYKFLLRPLFNSDPDTGLKFQLNTRITEADLIRDAKEIEEVILGFAPAKSDPYGEYLVIEVCGIDVSTSLDNAAVHAPDGCTEILNWQKKEFLWNELIAWANKEKGKGTFWVTEMADVIKKVYDGKCAPIMTSTFRGRGGQSLGLIFQPALYNVDYVDDKPVRFYFSFHQVLTPELVRGTGRIGDVFTALYTATRMRWEIIEPFYVKKLSRCTCDITEQKQLMEHVINGFRIIDEYSERQKVIEEVYNVIELNADPELKKLIELLSRQKAVKDDLFAAGLNLEFQKFMSLLAEMLDLNLQITEILAEKYLSLIDKDHKNLRAFLINYEIDKNRVIPKTTSFDALKRMPEMKEKRAPAFVVNY